MGASIFAGLNNYPHSAYHKQEFLVPVAGGEGLVVLIQLVKSTLIELPYVESGGLAGHGYGIDISQPDGSIWYSRLLATRLEGLIQFSCRGTEFDSPVRGPRRLLQSTNGTLWLTGYSEENWLV